MEQRKRMAVDKMLQRLIEMGVLKQSQCNGTALNFTVQALAEGLSDQKLIITDNQ